MLKISKLTLNCGNTVSADAVSKLSTFCEQVIDSAIVGCVTYLSTLAVTNNPLEWRGFLVGFGLTFVIKLKEYRNVK